MADVSQGPGWWQGRDGKWYAPQAGLSSQSPPQAATGFPPDAKSAKAAAKGAKAHAKALRPWYKKKRFIFSGLILVIILILLISTSGNKSNSTSGSSSVPGAGSSSGVSRHASVTSPSTPTVLYQQNGSGSASSPNFTAPTNWNIEWTYNCSALGSSGNFMVTVSQAGTGSLASLEDLPINQLGTSGSGVQHYHYGGKLYLAVNSECSWTIKAVGA